MTSLSKAFTVCAPYRLYADGRVLAWLCDNDGLGLSFYGNQKEAAGSAGGITVALIFPPPFPSVAIHQIVSIRIIFKMKIC